MGPPSRQARPGGSSRGRPVGPLCRLLGCAPLLLLLLPLLLLLVLLPLLPLLSLPPVPPIPPASQARPAAAG